MLDDVEQENLIELGDVDREFFPVEVPADKPGLLGCHGLVWCITVHPGHATASLDQFGRDVTLAATHIENMSAGPRRSDGRGVRRFITQLQVVGFLGRIDIELPVEKQTNLMKT